ncbi:CDP-diacylglycerol-glycerol-3-phosphate 3-phosphatidyltransferase [Macrolepiota fuliginosa MF-IS2]|uniref:CDP-diacylglycerol--glycerol-3-phosphate 3-phosphatidyltransferase n=1 Tax=Macrolepiota fuliginosa MF-IS2 TaxID=1400762 RepID=A0A9P5X6W9_9AGAR|nr:CDP-diacylglycerol-glycerol-3-phosphate 3-phosphatidyltransferase [Macrolepiota fuliginosa MF-IS2]
MFTVSRTLLPRTVWAGKTLLCCRTISTAYLDPIIQDFTSKIASKQPAFSLPPRQICILNQPTQFYSLLLEMIRRAEHRIFISSLYIGSEDTEILDTITEALGTKPSLHVYFQLDLNRSTRPGPSSTAKLLLPLLEKYPSRVNVSMFRSPSLRGIMAKVVPPRFNEGWGTWHAKVYGVDNEVIISGANLNKSYFTDRQDRYLHFKDQPLFAQYCYDFLQTAARFSFRLLPSSTPDTVTPYSDIRDGYVLQWSDADTHPHHINKKVKNALLEFQSSRRIASQIQLDTNEDSFKSEQQIMIFPVIQAGQFGIREEEATLQLLFRHINAAAKQGPRKRPLLDLTSGYFSLYQPYQKLVLGSRNVDCRIVAAGPKANGFFGSGGISGRIPEGYTYHEKSFMRAVRKAGRLWREAASGNFKGIQLSEWDRPGWTYHAKGIWLSSSSKSLPILTLFGSTNLNSRSSHLDTELSFVMVVPSRHGRAPEEETSSSQAIVDANPDALTSIERASGDSEEPPNTALSLRERLRHEIDNIRANATTWKGGQRKVRFSTKFIVWLVKGML